MRLWITRSEPGASDLAEQLRKLPLEIHKQPVVNISPLDPGTVPGGQPALIIVLSRHAAFYYLQSELLRPRISHIAIGSATAAELARAGIDAEVPQVSTSEGILAMPVCSDLKPTDVVWLIAGEGGRTTLADHLPAKVHKFSLYRREANPLDHVAVESLEIIEISSQFALNAVATRLAGRKSADQVYLVVPSERLQEHSRRIGFTRVQLAEGASAEAIAHAVTLVSGA